MKTSTKVILALWAAKALALGAVVALIRHKRGNDETAATHKHNKDHEA